jgi:hypothetical protein
MNYKAGGYEAHMTFDKEHATEVKKAIDYDVSDLGDFVFSIITGCPLLGPGTYCYLTSYSKDSPAHLVQRMQTAAMYFKEKGIPTLRSKVEHIVFDTKTGVNEL